MDEDKLDEFDLDFLSNKLNRKRDSEDNELDLNALQQVFDTTWGRSSTPKTSQFSVKFNLVGSDCLLASYCAIVNFTSDKERILQKRKYDEESTEVINAHVKAIKGRYKELSGKTLNIKEVSTESSVEIVGMNFYNPKRTAYVRRKTVFEVA